MTRIDIINTLIRRYGYKTYLEIGVHTKAHCFNHIIAQHKTSVDPGYENGNEHYDYRMESDKFFNALKSSETKLNPNMKWDIIFIDGLHLAEQVYRDVINSLEHLADGGTIVMHDCNPPHELIAREQMHPSWNHPGEWCGTTWKAFYHFRQTRPDLRMWCVDTDWGVGIIKPGISETAPRTNPFYEYETFRKNNVEYLNLISVDKFLELFGDSNV